MEIPNIEKTFETPKTKEDFLPNEFRREHVYDNGNKVIFLLLSNGSVATVREGTGKDVEAATLESNGSKEKYLTALTASCVKVDGKAVNMFELSERKMKDYLAIQSAFADINF